MNILIIGGGGREHAIAWTLHKSPRVGQLYAWPGNAGIAQFAECHAGSVMDFEGILGFLQTHTDIQMTFVAPDDPLAAGLVDFLEAHGHRAFGPSKAAAEIEGSKAFSKRLMKKYGIPSAAYEEFDDYQTALGYIKKQPYPLVIKADGLALGKGVVICETQKDAETALKEMMLDAKFGRAGKRVVIEEFMVGKEVSILAFTDGKTVVPMVSAQDHKRAYDNDQGLNTGGMGTFSPSKAYTAEISETVQKTIIEPTVLAMQKEGRPFKGVLYFGLMMCADGVKVVEYNARFGDPEAQVVLPRLKTDLTDILEAILEERLAEVEIEWTDTEAVCVILASGGYPGAYKKGLPIKIGELDADILLFHAGTAFDDAGDIVTAGGRVLGVTAVAKTMDEAREKAYRNIEKIHFDGMHYRQDIGIKK